MTSSIIIIIMTSNLTHVERVENWYELTEESSESIKDVQWEDHTHIVTSYFDINLISYRIP